MCYAHLAPDHLVDVIKRGPLSTRWLMYSIEGIFRRGYISLMTWYVEYTDEFGEWWEGLSADEQESVAIRAFVGRPRPVAWVSP